MSIRISPNYVKIWTTFTFLDISQYSGNLNKGTSAKANRQIKIKNHKAPYSRLKFIQRLINVSYAFSGSLIPFSLLLFAKRNRFVRVPRSLCAEEPHERQFHNRRPTIRLDLSIKPVFPGPLASLVAFTHRRIRLGIKSERR